MNQTKLTALQQSNQFITKQVGETVINLYGIELTRIARRIDGLSHNVRAFSVPLFAKQDEKAILAEMEGDISMLIQKIEDDMEREVHSVEVEMHGSEVFSRDESNRIAKCAEKKALLDTLRDVRRLVREELNELPSSHSMTHIR